MDNVYEDFVSCSNRNNPGLADTNLSSPSNIYTNLQSGSALPRKSQTVVQQTSSKWTKREKIFAMVIVVLLIILIAFGIYDVVKEERRFGCAESKFLNSGATSCLELKQLGAVKNGNYVISMNGSQESYKVYCDMETAGGGWTLVATINEQSIDSRCTAEDRWISDSPLSPTDPYGTRLWENKDIFGQLERASSDDYKNQGYYAIQASDVLVRHVPNDKDDLEKSKEEAFLEYHSTNGFLKQYGGNLYSVYRDHFPLTPTGSDISPPSTIEKVLDALVRNASNIISNITDFYYYPYSSCSHYKILDPTLFNSYGMEVRSSCGSYVYCGSRTYGCGNGDISNRRSHPFFVLMSLRNDDFAYQSRYYQVRSYRDASDFTLEYTRELQRGNYLLRYNARCRYGGSAPSLCDVAYVVSNTKDWRSIPTFQFPSSTVTQSSSSYYDFRQYVNNYPHNILFGYTMLTRNNGQLLTRQQTESVMIKILAVISNYPNIFPKLACADSSLNLAVSVKYTVGESELFNHIPPVLNSTHLVTPGYMQFRAGTTTGNFQAFCPVVKLDTCASQYLCVGGVNRFSSSIYFGSSGCNDFSAWNGAGNALSNLNLNKGKGLAHSLQDIHSSIMIFYR